MSCYILQSGLLFFHNISQETTGNPEHFPHTHESCELYFFVRGSCNYSVENGVYETVPGTVIFTQPGEMHSVNISEPCLYERYYIQIDPRIFEWLGYTSLLRCFYHRPHGQNNSIVLPPEDAEHCFYLLSRIETLMTEDGPDAAALSFGILIEMLHTVNLRASDPSAYHANRVRSPLVNEAMQYINDHLSQVTSSAALAARLYVSREYLSRQFSLYMGLTLNRYITLKRVSCAKRLLEQGHSLNDVCTACGWQDYSYFVAVFRREVGMTPMKYRSFKQSSL